MQTARSIGLRSGGIFFHFFSEDCFSRLFLLEQGPPSGISFEAPTNSGDREHYFFRCGTAEIRAPPVARRKKESTAGLDQSEAVDPLHPLTVC